MGHFHHDDVQGKCRTGSVVPIVPGCCRLTTNSEMDAQATPARERVARLLPKGQRDLAFRFLETMKIPARLLTLFAVQPSIYRCEHVVPVARRKPSPEIPSPSPTPG